MSAIPEGSAPAIITAHAFEPDGEWWTRCGLCGLAEAAHAFTTLAPDPGHLTREDCGHGWASS